MLTHSSDSHSPHNINVLLVEDSRKDALLTRWSLSAIDDEFFFQRAKSLHEALAKIRTNDVSVLVLDLGLPDSDGSRSIHTLTEEFPDLPIVVLSGRSDEVSMLSALENGAQEFLVKGECSGVMIRQALRSAMFRKSMNKMSLS